MSITALIFTSLALAAPPSSTLTGDEGTLSWQVTEQSGQVRIEGSSWKWQVEHTAKADLTPIRTTHTNTEDGSVVVVDYGSQGVTVRLPGKTVSHDETDLWDADTLDIRLGANVADGRTDMRFSAVDTGSGKVYEFDSAKVADEQCGATACTHIQMQLTGLLRLVGPTWSYWYAADGRLLKFDGPIGTFTASE